MISLLKAEAIVAVLAAVVLAGCASLPGGNLAATVTTSSSSGGWCDAGSAVFLEGEYVPIVGKEMRFGIEACHLRQTKGSVTADLYLDEEALAALKSKGVQDGSGCIILTDGDSNSTTQLCFGSAVAEEDDPYDNEFAKAIAGS